MNFDQNRNQMQQRMNRQGTNTQNVSQFGAHEVLMTHEVLSDKINGINQFELYRPHVKDQQLGQILDNQINFMIQGYNNLVNFLHQSGGSQAVPYRTPKSANIKYGLRNPSPLSPNMDINQMDDIDVAAGMLTWAKASAMMQTTAAVECANPTLRQMMVNCIETSINMAYETFQFMNQKGYYQVPTLQENTTRTVIDTYQPTNNRMTQMSYL